jgi:hypothetical protein
LRLYLNNCGLLSRLWFEKSEFGKLELGHSGF